MLKNERVILLNAQVCIEMLLNQGFYRRWKLAVDIIISVDWVWTHAQYTITFKVLHIYLPWLLLKEFK